jgi:pimeloyl-ACP methyl ester carboxylesterase
MSAATALPAAATHAASAADVAMKRAYVDGPFGQVHFQYAPAGDPLVILHQTASSSRQFVRVYPLFAARGFRPIGIDLPGFGGTDPTTAPPSIGDWVKVIPPVLDALGILEAEIVGHHTGSTVATEFSLTYPARVRKLVIHGAYIMTEAERADRLARLDRLGRSNIQPDGSHLAAAYVSRSKLYGSADDPEAVMRYLTDGLLISGPRWYGVHAVFTYDQAAALKRVSHPTLLLSNDGDQIFAETKRARALRSDCTYVEIPGGTVDIQDQKPAEWVDAIATFLRQP